MDNYYCFKYDSTLSRHNSNSSIYYDALSRSTSSFSLYNTPKELTTIMQELTMKKAQSQLIIAIQENYFHKCIFMSCQSQLQETDNAVYL